MNRTTNYKLCQWERSDKVLMEDFNADNAKLDAAIKGQANALEAERAARISAVQAARDACPLVVLRSVTLTASAPRYDLSLTGFNWDDYGEITIYTKIKGASYSIGLKVLLNNISTANYYAGPAGRQGVLFATNTYLQGHSIQCRVPRRTSGFRSLWTTEEGWSSPQGYYVSASSEPLASFTTMNFICEDADRPFPAGTRFTILGIRA